MQNFEQDLGATLLDRNTKLLRLTRGCACTSSARRSCARSTRYANPVVARAMDGTVNHIVGLMAVLHTSANWYFCQLSISPPPIIFVITTRMSKMKRFYRSNLLSTLIERNSTLQMFSQHRQILAIKRNAPSATDLLKINNMLTPESANHYGVQNPLSHTAFGFMNLPASMPVGFNGEHPDLHTGMYGLGQGQRWYSTALMRFSCPDSISPFGEGGINAYAYVHNDPVNLIDPDGHKAVFRANDGLKYTSFNNLKMVHDLKNSAGIYEAPSKLLWKRKPKLIVNTQGLPDRVAIGNELLTAEAFTQRLNSMNIDPRKYRNVTFISCSTGQGFAQEFANINGVKTKAPNGIVWASRQSNSQGTEFALGMVNRRYEQGERELSRADRVFGGAYTLKTFMPIRNL